MFSFIKFSKYKGENIYDIRLSLSEKDKLLDKYNMNFKYEEKKYYLNNVVITINPTETTYHYEEDISINIENDYIIREYIIRECPQFNFYESDSEEIYKLYENGDRTILLKEYNKYCSFEINTNNKDIKI